MQKYLGLYNYTEEAGDSWFQGTNLITQSVPLIFFFEYLAVNVNAGWSFYCNRNKGFI